MLENYYKQVFGDEWYKLLEKFLLSQEMRNISYTVAQDRIKGNVIPSAGSETLFRVFKDLQPSNIKVIILAQDPYPQPDIYDGYAFSNSNSLDASPSLKNIISEIEKEYPKEFNLDRMDWKYLINQGVFSINTALSLREHMPGSHLKIWYNFTVNWIKTLNNEYNDIIWLLWGRKAQAYKSFITNKSHSVIETSHPSPLGCTNNAPISFIDSKCFSKTNYELEIRNKNKIIW